MAILFTEFGCAVKLCISFAIILQFYLDQKVADTTEVGKYPNGASPYGALDMAANVLEWVNDAYDEKYYAISPEVNPTGALIGNSRVIRGGSWNLSQSSMRVSARRDGKPFDPAYNLGFRCAQSAS